MGSVSQWIGGEARSRGGQATLERFIAGWWYRAKLKEFPRPAMKILLGIRRGSSVRSSPKAYV